MFNSIKNFFINIYFDIVFWWNGGNSLIYKEIQDDAEEIKYEGY
tara:strand:- start:581 stop:712 length:132 start_codon:yes stop_codon:yes gene_type:complete